MAVYSKDDRAHLRRDMRPNVELTMAQLRQSIGRSSWIPKSNRYSRNVVAKIRKELSGTTRSVKSSRHLAQYVTASSLLHCSDGWSYLGRALHAILWGDPHRAVHLAYYAELRAAMSLLASEGIGIFNRQHFFVDGPDRVTRAKSGAGTHDFVWDCLETWSGQARSGVLFSSIVTPNQLPLTEWLQPIGGASAAQPKARQWFRQWGMDLRLQTRDRDARNESSYRPDGIPVSWKSNVKDALDFALQAWDALGQGGKASFGELDRHILRITLDTTFKGRTGSSPSDDPAAFRSFIDGVLKYLGLDERLSQKWRLFLTREENSEDHTILKHSANVSVDDISAEGIWSRAALLLRLASGSVLRLLMAAGISGDEIRFWWNDLGQSRGIWTGDRDIDDLEDLWADIDPVLEQLRQYQADTPSDHKTFHDAGTKLANAIAALGGCERFAIWSMTPLGS